MAQQSAHLKYTPSQVFPLFQRFLAVEVVQDLVRATTQHVYTRLYPPLIVLWGFLFQRLDADHTCDAFVSALTGGSLEELRTAAGTAGKPMAESTSAYCQARERLPLSLADAALHHTVHALQAELGPQALWRGWQVGLLDGSTLRLGAEPGLSAHYGLPSGQHGASHWPRLRTAVAFDLFSGAVIAVAEGPYATSEHSLAIQLIRQVAWPVIFVGDQLYGIYHLVQVVTAGPHQAVFRIQASHARRWFQGRLPSGSDRAVVWTPSPHDQVEADLPRRAIPGRLLYVRIEHPGFRPKDIYLFTTLTDAAAFPLEAILKLYARRWNVELDLRDVKTRLEMEKLDGQSVDMVRKELVLGLLAYNLIRGLMGQAALRSGLSGLALSFARCWRRITRSALRLATPGAAPDPQGEVDRLMVRLGQCKLPVRKEIRFEPRGIWAKPHQYPYLNGSRAEARIAWIETLKQKS